MTRDNWEVKEEGIRPAGSDNNCFYCGEEKGNTHKPECVIRKRTIVMEMKVEIVMEVPEHWDEEMCNFHKNESSWCASNILDDLKKLDEKGCLCGITKFTYLREATKEDEEEQNIFIDKVLS